MGKENLLERAKNFKTKKSSKIYIDDSIIELTLAWVNDEINMRQYAHALEKEVGVQTYIIIANALKEYIKN